MIKNLSKLKYWELAALGLACAVTAGLLLAFVVRLVVGTWPQTVEVGHIAYVVVSASLAWLIVGVFVEAGFQKDREARQAKATDNILDMTAGYNALGGAAPPFVAEQAEPVDLDQVAVDPGLVEENEKEKEKERDCG